MIAARCGVMLTILLSACAFGGPKRTEQASTPVPLDALVALPSFDWSSSFELSPDGASLAYSYKTPGAIPFVEGRYLATGVPRYSNADAQVHVAIVDVATGASKPLGDPASTRWSPVWSPDGERLAFFSDEGGAAGLWIWEAGEQRAWRFPGAIVRPDALAEAASWLADNRHVLCTILPEDLGLAAANAADLASMQIFAPATAGSVSVTVLPFSAAPRRAAPQSRPSELALLDLETRTITRLGPRQSAGWSAASPDGRYVARTLAVMNDADNPRPHQDLILHDVASRAARTLHLPQSGQSWSWSPRGDRLAYYVLTPSGTAVPKVQLAVLTVADGNIRILDDANVPIIRQQHRPLWNRRGDGLFVLAAQPAERPNDDWYFAARDELWRIETTSSRARRVADLPGLEITGVVTQPDQPTAWSAGAREAVWVLTRSADRVWPAGTSLHELDVAKGRSVRSFEMNTGWHSRLTGNDRTRQIAFISTDQQRPPDVWSLSARDGRRRQLTRHGTGIEGYRLGSSRLIEYDGPDGRRLRGALLLPPDYRHTERLPLVVWVMGYEHDSQHVDAFGFYGNQGGLTPVHNMQVLATRGYAVLIPDVPQRPGEQMTDILAAVNAAVDAAIAQGYADSDRLAIMGYSSGSYAVLATITQTERFKAAVLTGATTFPDLLADYLLSDPKSSEVMSKYEAARAPGMGGTPWTQRERYLRNSPIQAFDRIRTPVLIGQGSADGMLAANAIYAALNRLRRPAEYRLYEHEEHNLQRAANVVDFWERRLAFLEQHVRAAPESNQTRVSETAPNVAR